MTRDEILALVEERDIKFIRFWFTDVLGQLKSSKALGRLVIDLDSVLQGSIGLQPQLRLHHINTSHRAKLCSVGQCRVVLPAQVSLEPNQLVAHGGVGDLCLRQASEQ